MIEIILLITITALTRFIPHLPNFSPLVAVALFSGVYLKKRFSFLVPLAIFVVSDAVIGMHDAVAITWLSILIIYFLGYYVRNHKTVTHILSFTFLSSCIFFLLTNFGVWLFGWYPHTPAGLADCFIRAIPFFRTSLVADFVYVGLLFGVYELLVARRKLPLKQPLS